MPNKLHAEISSYAKTVEQYLSLALQSKDHDTARVWDAMRYSALSGGKRIRPYLTKAISDMLGGNPEVALVFGAAVEMVHAYSLIHDDLPCMDNDDYRRGRPTCHKRFDEATAVLAGDALLSHAFSLIVDSNATDKQKLCAIRILTESAGANGMIGGQIMDLQAMRAPISEQTLLKLHRLKTGELLVCAAKLGCIAADCYEGDTFDACVKYADDVGLAFQIVDDILDQYGTTAIGKPMYSDSESGKTTFLTFADLAGAREKASALTESAVKAIAHLSNSATPIELARTLLMREK